MATVSQPTSLPAGGASLVLPHGREAAVVAFETGVVDYFVGTAELLGVPKSVAAIYAIVFASPTSLTFADIEARLDLSKGSISQGLRVLRDIGALKEVSTSAERAERFEPDLELRRLAERFLEHRLQKQFEAGGKTLVALKNGLGAFTDGGNATMHSRVKKLQQWQDRSKALLPVIRSFLKLGAL